MLTVVFAVLFGIMAGFAARQRQDLQEAKGLDLQNQRIIHDLELVIARHEANIDDYLSSLTMVLNANGEAS